jgi:hypothetical protein
MDAISKLQALLKRIEGCDAPYDLKHVRDGFFLIAVATPGRRWEIEVSLDGQVEVEIFKSDGKILEEAALNDLWKDLE